jgi:hypothetical protein
MPQNPLIAAGGVKTKKYETNPTCPRPASTPPGSSTYGHIPRAFSRASVPPPPMRTLNTKSERFMTGYVASFSKFTRRGRGGRLRVTESSRIRFLCCLRFLRVQKPFVFFVSSFFCHQSFCRFLIVVNAMQFRVTAPVLTERLMTEIRNARMSLTTSHSPPGREYPAMMLQCPFGGGFRRVFDFGINPFDGRRGAAYIDGYDEP